MTDLDIVIADHAKNHSEFPLEECLLAYELALLDPTFKRYRNGNSLLFIRNFGKGCGHFHFVNADRTAAFIDNVKACMAKAKDDGFHTLTTDYTNPKVTEVAKATGLNIEYDTRNVGGKDKLWLIVRL